MVRHQRNLQLRRGGLLGAGYSVSDILFNIVVTGAVNLIFTSLRLVLWIAMEDEFNAHWRRGLAISTRSLEPLLRFTVVAFTCSSWLSWPSDAMPCRSLPVTWVVISEIFPNRVRGAAMSVAVTALWLASFILTYTFPLFNHALGAAWTFWIYAIVCVAGFVFIKARLPETKGKTLEQIEGLWK